MSTLLKLLLIWVVGNMVASRRRVEQQRRQKPKPTLPREIGRRFQAQTSPGKSAATPSVPAGREDGVSPALKKRSTKPLTSVPTVDTGARLGPSAPALQLNQRTFVQSFMLMQVLGEPRFRCPWQPR
ncbi:MAG TPA: hypothetical protein VJ036_01050 [bacterium]|jgi:hypothetical protein|nr:hypothetical protein [bacterium]